MLNLVIAIVYAIAARLSLDFATLPNKVSAVWLPSGMTTAWMSWFGVRNVVPGIFVGVLIGIFPDLLTMTPMLSVSSMVFLGLVIAVGDCLQPFVIVTIIKRFAVLPLMFNQVRTVTIFILATLAGPCVSATLGVTALYIVQPTTWNQYVISWITWCLASTLANLLFTPLFLLWKRRSQFKAQAHWIEWSLLLGLILFLSWLTFVKSYPVEYMFLPLLIWSAFRLGSFFTSALIALISIIAIPMTARGFGPFTVRSPNESLLLLQSFIAVCSVTNIVLTAAIRERRVAELALENALASLEQQVQHRTSQLQESKAIVDAFFSSAPLGLGIVNDDLEYVQVNNLFANFNGMPIEDHLGHTIVEISPERSSNLEPLYQQVLITGKPILNREETRVSQTNPSEERTWLMSYFPIATHNLISKVGIIVMEISDHKKLEHQLKLQARRDPLTALSNRLHFKEASELEWKRCQRSSQPFSLILLDIDYFKRYNDTYGHLAGDACLVQVAQLLMKVVGRIGDLVVRFGGEEFVVMLPGTDAIGTAHVGGFIRQLLSEQKIPHSSSSVCDYVTVSMGVVSCIPNAAVQIDDVIQRADEALYESKRLGRNRMTIATIKS